jgi:hypothetical protein
MSHTHLIAANEATVSYREQQKELVVTARVTKRGGEDVRIIQVGLDPGTGAPAAAMEFAVVGRVTPGIHPELILQNVLVEGVFSVAGNPGTVIVLSQGPDGPTRTRVNVGVAPVVPVAAAAAKSPVIGWSEQLHFDEAIADAVAQLPRPANPDIPRAGIVTEVGVRVGGNMRPTGMYVKLLPA